MRVVQQGVRGGGRRLTSPRQVLCELPVGFDSRQDAGVPVADQAVGTIAVRARAFQLSELKVDGVGGHVPQHLAAPGVRRSSEEGRVELQIRPAKPGYRVKSFAAQLLLGPHPAKIDETDAPAVVVISSSREEQVLQRTGTDRQAQAALRRFEAKRQKLGDQEFCRVYEIPERFAQ